METIKERIKLRREFLGLTQKDLAHAIGKDSNNEISRWENGKTITDKNLKKIAIALKTNFQYLKFGIGEIDKEIDNIGNEAFKTALTNKKILPITEFISLREICEVRAGGFTTLINLNNELITHIFPKLILPIKFHHLAMEELQERFFVFIVKGDSMSPRIQEGDILIVEKIDNLEEVNTNDIIIIADDDNHIIVKRLKKKNGEITLISDNPAYNPITVKVNLNTIGKVVSFMAGSV